MKDEIKEFFAKHYRTKDRMGTHNGVCVAVVEKNDGKITKHTELPCHAFLRGMGNPEVAWVHSSLWIGTPGNREKAHKYWDLINNPLISPWSSILKDSYITTNDKGDYIAISVAITDETPFDVLFNFLIATRLPYEHTYLLDCFYLAYERGFSLGECLWISSQLGFLKGTFVRNGNRNWHVAFDPYRVSCKRLSEMNPKCEKNKTFRSGRYGNFSDYMWKGVGESYDFPIMSFIHDEKEKYTGKFENAFRFLVSHSLNWGQGKIPNNVLDNLYLRREEWRNS